MVLDHSLHLYRYVHQNQCQNYLLNNYQLIQYMPLYMSHVAIRDCDLVKGNAFLLVMAHGLSETFFIEQYCKDFDHHHIFFVVIEIKDYCNLRRPDQNHRHWAKNAHDHFKLPNLLGSRSCSLINLNSIFQPKLYFICLNHRQAHQMTLMKASTCFNFKK